MGVTSSRSRGTGASVAVTLDRTILVVEDFDELRESIVSSLRQLRYRVEEAIDGGQAVRHASKGSADVIVLDVSLPIMNGIEVARRIRKLGAAKRPHIIMTSAHADARTRQLAFEAGCDQYIVKPMDFDALAAAIDAFFVKRDGR
jgi:DNA-binding response OmpR family regulator